MIGAAQVKPATACCGSIFDRGAYRTSLAASSLARSRASKVKRAPRLRRFGRRRAKQDESACLFVCLQVESCCCSFRGCPLLNNRAEKFLASLRSLPNYLATVSMIEDAKAAVACKVERSELHDEVFNLYRANRARCEVERRQTTSAPACC